MNRFFVASSQVNIPSQEIVITGEDVKHISKVLRLSEGDVVEVCDGEIQQYLAEIKAISKDEVLLDIKEKEPIKTEAPIEVVLYQSVPKSTKMELIIQKTTELGIKEIVPVITDRTIVQFKDHKDKSKKVDRWQKIAEEAAKQSKRGIIPIIHTPISYKEALEHCKENDLNIVAYEKEDTKGLKELFSNLNIEKIKRIGIWVGPEGGFTEEEVEVALQNHINSVTLGPRILRTETAGFTLLSILMYQLGDLGG
ncbi:MAG: 16S rRNA (uracil(1498)-N(3))-methyltransferase [Clostridiaceae bacterium]|nr:16S rRNA (uracil(1498)-N(3))-methyltransferase [Clostridiaceae bacterium]